MATLSFPRIGSAVCATPQAISVVQVPVLCFISGLLTVGVGRVFLVSDSPWYYSSDGVGSTMLVPAQSVLCLPMYTDLLIYAATVAGEGTLYAVLGEAGSLCGVGMRSDPEDPDASACPQAGTLDFSVSCTSGLIAVLAA